MIVQPLLFCSMPQNDSYTWHMALRSTNVILREGLLAQFLIQYSTAILRSLEHPAQAEVVVSGQ